MDFLQLARESEKAFKDMPFSEFIINTKRKAKDVQAALNKVNVVTVEIIQQQGERKQNDTLLSIADFMRKKGWNNLGEVPTEVVNSEKFATSILDPANAIWEAAGKKVKKTFVNARANETIRNLTAQTLTDKLGFSSWNTIKKGNKEWFSGRGKIRTLGYAPGTAEGIRKALVEIKDTLHKVPSLKKLRPKAGTKIGQDAILEIAVKTFQGPRGTDFIEMTADNLNYSNNIIEFKTKTTRGKEVTSRTLYRETQALIKGHLGDDPEAVMSSKKGPIFWPDIKSEKNRKKYADLIDQNTNRIFKKHIPKVPVMVTATGEKELKEFGNWAFRHYATDTLENVGTSAASTVIPASDIEKDHVFGRTTGQQTIQRGTYKGVIKKASKRILDSGTEAVNMFFIAAGFPDGFSQFAEHFGLAARGEVPADKFSPLILDNSSQLKEFEHIRQKGVSTYTPDGTEKRIPLNQYVNENQASFKTMGAYTDEAAPPPVDMATGEGAGQPEVQRMSQETQDETIARQHLFEQERIAKKEALKEELRKLYPDKEAFTDADLESVIDNNKAVSDRKKLDSILFRDKNLTAVELEGGGTAFEGTSTLEDFGNAQREHKKLIGPTRGVTKGQYDKWANNLGIPSSDVDPEAAEGVALENKINDSIDSLDPKTKDAGLSTEEKIALQRKVRREAALKGAKIVAGAVAGPAGFLWDVGEAVATPSQTFPGAVTEDLPVSQVGEALRTGKAPPRSGEMVARTDELEADLQRRYDEGRKASITQQARQYEDMRVSPQDSEAVQQMMSEGFVKAEKDFLESEVVKEWDAYFTARDRNMDAASFMQAPDASDEKEPIDVYFTSPEAQTAGFPQPPKGFVNR